MSSYPAESRRRLACDRCHAQKLRCLRTGNSSEAGGDCDRCLRAATPCVYSPPNRIGRPARSRTNTTNSHQKTTRGGGAWSSTGQDQRTASSQDLSNNNPDDPGRPTSGETTMNNAASVEVVPPEASMFDNFHSNSATTDVDLMAFLNDSPMSFEDEGVAGFGTSASYSLPDEGLDTRNEVEFTPPPPPCPNNTGGLESTAAGDSMDGDHVRELLDLVLSQHEQLRIFEQSRSESSSTWAVDKHSLFARLHNYPVGGMMENARKLTELVDELGKAASRQRSESSTTTAASWNGHNSMGGSPDFAGQADYFTSSNTTSRPQGESSLFGVNFPSSSFLPPADLCAIPTPKTSSSSTSVGGNWNAPTTSAPGPGGGGRTTAAASAPRMDMSTTLLVVSCYLRLARLFVLFFTDLHRFLSNHPPGTPPISETGNVPRLFPGLKLGSFQPFAGIGLEISIVVQVSEHMLSRVHNAMGWTREHSPSGTASVESSSSFFFNGGGGGGGISSGAWNRNPMEMITPTLMRAVQAQERLDVQDERGDSFTQLSLMIDEVKKLLRAKPFL